MIVVDSQLIAYLLLPGEHTGLAEQLYRSNPHWIAPQNWKLEFLDILRRYEEEAKSGILNTHQVLIHAEKLMEKGTYDVGLDRALSMSRRLKSTITAGFYMALAEDQNTKFYTFRKEFLYASPALAVDPSVRGEVR